MLRKARLAAVWMSLLSASTFGWAQKEGADASAAILSLDASFWQAYNACDLSAFQQFFAEDVEFYHDKGGATLGREALTSAMRAGVCAPDGPRIRREEATGSVRLFPLRRDGAVYGAVLTGEHLFHLTEKGRPERLDGRARFTHLWLLKDGAWKMARVLSYDHGPAPYASPRTSVVVPDPVLQELVGSYLGPKAGTVDVRRGAAPSDAGSVLLLSWGSGGLTVYAESPDTFFAKERDLTFEFLRDGGVVTGMRIRENGGVVEEPKRVR